MNTAITAGALFEALVLGVALAMDAMAVTLSNTLCEPDMPRAKKLAMPVTFALFQAAMPVAGFFGGRLVASPARAGHGPHGVQHGPRHLGRLQQAGGGIVEVYHGATSRYFPPGSARNSRPCGTPERASTASASWKRRGETFTQ